MIMSIDAIHQQQMGTINVRFHRKLQKMTGGGNGTTFQVVI